MLCVICFFDVTTGQICEYMKQRKAASSDREMRRVRCGTRVPRGYFMEQRAVEMTTLLDSGTLNSEMQPQFSKRAVVEEAW